MIEIQGYHVDQELFDQGTLAVYRGVGDQNQAPVIVKVLKSEFPSPKELTRIKQEYEITKQLNIPGVLHALSLEKFRNSPALILEGFSGQTLKELLSKRKLTLPEFLQISIQLAEIIGQVHKHQIIHKDIHPQNILINPETLEVRLTGFGISTQLSRESQQIGHASLLEGTLAYMSPEQTGRMNRAVDYRTDLYSLGITFYEMLIGNVPFRSQDALEVVHSHIAKRAVPPHTHDPEIPAAVSEIVMKLLAKTSEERYRSAHGLKADLETCLSQLKTKGAIDFKIGEQDISDTFDIPQKLYGRDKEVRVLLDTFDRVSEGTSELMLVAGYSGIGKSSLIYETHKPIVRQRGFFISGKYDQFTRSNPYHALIQAFGELVRQILTENENKITEWRDKITAALGPNGQVIIDVIPEVELIIGKQSSVPSLPPTESQNRFNHVFRDFVRVFAQYDHPLVMFMDDLQWADSASLKLIDLIITDSDTKYLFMIGAYRDNEVSVSHPLLITLEEIKKASVTMNTVTLSPLEREHLLILVADTLSCKTDAVTALTDLVMKKTGGNPFFANEFLKTLYQEKLVEFSWEEKRWVWDLKEIEEKGITDNVVELMTRKIERLPKTTQEVLKLAACIGNRFDLETLAIVNVKTPGQTAAELWEAVREGLIIPIGEAAGYLQTVMHDPSGDGTLKGLNIICKFLHDRVQQAAYTLLTEQQKKETHLKIGRLLLDVVDTETLQEKVFDIVNQLNAGADLITETTEKKRLAELNLIAGKQAKTSTAYDSALGYLRMGMNLLSENSWEKDYELTLNLHLERAECAYLSIQFDEAERLFETVLKMAKTTLEKVEIYRIKATLYQNAGKAPDAIRIGREGLKLLNIKLPTHTNKLHVILEVVKVKMSLGKRKIEDLLQAPDMTDPDKSATLTLLRSIADAAYFVNADLFVLISLKMTTLSLRYGNAKDTAFAYVVYSMLLSSVLGDFKSGQQMGLLTFKINEKFDLKQSKSKLNFIMGCFVNHWTKHMKSCAAFLRESYQEGIEYGDFNYAGYSAIVDHYQPLMRGDPLDTVLQEGKKYLDFMSKTKQTSTILASVTTQQLTLCLKGLTKGPGSFDDDHYDETSHLAKLEKSNFGAGINWHKAARLQALYLFGCYEEALKSALLAVPTIDDTNLCTAILKEFYLYYPLTLVALYREVSADQKQKYINTIKKIQKMLKLWADNCPENSLHKYLLVQAELARLHGHVDKAMKLYTQAIEEAKKNEYLNNEALGNELAAKFYLEQGIETNAQAHMVKARYLYNQWGARGKVKDLEEKYPQFFQEEKALTEKAAPGTEAAPGRLDDQMDRLDINAMMQASQTISGEMVLATLLEKVMQIAIRNAGGQRGFLMLVRDDKLFIEAEGFAGGESVKVLQSQPVEGHPRICSGIAHYVMRTQQHVVLNNATKEGRFTEDPYIVKNKTKSIICVPIIFQNKLAGMFYLENNLTANAFTPDRLEVLHLLASQAALAISQAESAIDSLTRLWTRKNFMERAEREFKKVQDEKQSACVFMLDLDHFKQKNDTYGHLVGDIVLKDVAARIKSTLRDWDCLGRYGGEEFILLLPNTSDVKAQNVARRILEVVSQDPIAADGQKFQQTVSIGMAIYPDDGKALSDLIAQADKALYKAKNTGRNRACR